MGEAAGKQRAMVEAGHLLLVLHPVPGDAPGPAKLFWRAPDGTWKAAGLGNGIGPLEEHLGEFELHVDDLEERLQRAITAQAWFDVLKAATPLQRTVHHLASALQAAREAVDDRTLINLRDRAVELDRTLDLLTVEARDALDFVSAQKAEAQAQHGLELARVSHRLNVITATFLPITALASVFGMTMRSGIETWGAPWTFWIVVGGGILLGLFVRRRLHPSQTS
jgi:hypothetical protein